MGRQTEWYRMDNKEELKVSQCGVGTTVVDYQVDYEFGRLGGREGG